MVKMSVDGIEAMHYKRQMTGQVKWEDVVELETRWANYQHLERSYLYLESECCILALTSAKNPLCQVYESGRKKNYANFTKFKYYLV